MNIFLFECLPYPIACYPSVTELAILNIHDIDTLYFQSFPLCFFEVCACIDIKVSSWIGVNSKHKKVCIGQFTLVDPYFGIHKTLNISISLVFLFLRWLVTSTTEK